MARILCIPDIHCPSDHPKAIDHCKRVYNDFKCDRVIQLGDEVDLASFSKFPLDPDAPSAGHELELAIESLERWYRAFPYVDVIGSNHGMRIFRKGFASGFPRSVFKRYEEIFKFPKGWSFHPHGIECDQVSFIHGEGFSSSTWRVAHQRAKQSVVMGHLHSGAGVVYSQTKRRHFAMNAGCLIDPSAPAFAYGSHLIEKPMLGCGVVLDGVEAHFIPLKT